MVRRTDSSSNFLTSVAHTTTAFAAGAKVTPEESAYEGFKYLANSVAKLAYKAPGATKNILRKMAASISELPLAIAIFSREISNYVNLRFQGDGRYDAEDGRSLVDRVTHTPDLTTYYDD